MIEFEVMLVDTFGWSLREIDETDIESLIPFAFEYPKIKAKKGVSEKRNRMFADQVDWL